MRVKEDIYKINTAENYIQTKVHHTNKATLGEHSPKNVL